MLMVCRRSLRLAAAAFVSVALLASGMPSSSSAAPSMTDTPTGRFQPAAEGGIEGAYMVVLATDGKEELTRKKIDATTARLVKEYGGKLEYTYYHAFPGFAAFMAEHMAKALAKNLEVAYVAQQGELVFLGEQSDAPWGLDILDQRRGMDDTYRWDTDGTGVNAYVFDSGIRQTHRDFDGRVATTLNFGDPGTGPDGSHDCNGHGTMMAGVVGGRVHGVAKNVRLHSLRIGCRVGRDAALVAAVDWMAVNAVRPAVANFSFQSRPSLIVDAAAAALISRGIAVVTAAGNSDQDACNFSPARVPQVITVGAVHALKDRMPGTGWGSCLDLFAPGDRNPTTSNSGDTATTAAGLTSIATAHVTGAVARYLQRFPDASPAVVAATLVGEATNDRIIDHRGSPNRVLYLDLGGPGGGGFGRTGADVNGDGRDDIVTFLRGASADVYVALSNGSSFGAGTKWHEYFSADEEIPLLGDVNGDGRDDLITFTRGDSADVYVALSTGSSFGPAQRWHTWFAIGNETPIVGDFNGDGRDDIATVTRGVFDNPAVGRSAYVALSTGAHFGGAIRWSDNFLGGDAVPMAGDFDCDGRDDLVAFERGGAGRLLVASSQGDRFAAATYWGHRFALGTAVPAVGDVNGDGCDDVVEFSRGDAPFVRVALSMAGYWAWRSFGDPTVWHRNFAGGVDMPGVGDFTGDGRDDIVAFTRGHAADVYVAPSTTGPAFSTDVRRWHDWFAYGSEIPMPAVTW